MKNVIVCKFGGSSLASIEGVKNIINIAKDNKQRKIFVFSAVGKSYQKSQKTTDLLIEIYNALKYNDYNKFEDIWKLIRIKYITVFSQFIPQKFILRLLKNTRQSILKNPTHAFILSRGEYLSAVFMAKVLNLPFIDPYCIFSIYNSSINKPLSSCRKNNLCCKTTSMLIQPHSSCCEVASSSSQPHSSCRKNNLCCKVTSSLNETLGSCCEVASSSSQPHSSCRKVVSSLNESMLIDYNQTKRNIINVMKVHSSFVTGGFYGKAVDVNTNAFDIDSAGKKVRHYALFKRGGSDISGAILASMVDACMYENWTDVNGVMTANPRIVLSAKTINRLSYRQINEMGRYGAGIFHFDAVSFLSAKNTLTNIKNTFSPTFNGTHLCNYVEISPFISYLENCHMYSIEINDLFNIDNLFNLSSVKSALIDANISQSKVIIVLGCPNKLASQDLIKITGVQQVELKTDKALIRLYTKELISSNQCFSFFKEWGVEYFNGESNSLSLLIDNKSLVSAVNILHQAIF